MRPEGGVVEARFVRIVGSFGLKLSGEWHGGHGGAKAVAMALRGRYARRSIVAVAIPLESGVE